MTRSIDRDSPSKGVRCDGFLAAKEFSVSISSSERFNAFDYAILKALLPGGQKRMLIDAKMIQDGGDRVETSHDSEGPGERIVCLRQTPIIRMRN
jgi:hypothetical protein